PDVTATLSSDTFNPNPNPSAKLGYLSFLLSWLLLELLDSLGVRLGQHAVHELAEVTNICDVRGDQRLLRGPRLHQRAGSGHICAHNTRKQPFRHSHARGNTESTHRRLLKARI